MTTKEKSGYDFDMILGKTIVFIQLNFNQQANIVFEQDSFWKEAQRFPMPGMAGYTAQTGMSRWQMYEKPIVATWKVTGKGLPIPNVSIY